ncbi:MAG: hypothetical protein ACK5IB_01495 [Qingshengfaniella sp.]
MALSSAALAQTTINENTPRITGFFESSVQANDNYDLRKKSLGDAGIWTNTIGAGLVDSTPADRLELNARGSYRYANLPKISDERGFDDQRVGFNYERIGNDDTINAQASYTRNDLDFFNPLDDIDDDGTFDNTSSTGTREALRARLSLAINQEAPIGVDLNGYYNKIDFSGDHSDDLVDREDYGLNGEVGFRLSRTLRATVGGAYQYRYADEDRETDRTTRSANVGLDARLNERLSGYVRLGYSIVEIEDRSPDRSRDEEGIIGNIGFTADMPNGTFSGSFRSIVDENGERVTLSFGRSFALPRAEFSGNIGVSSSSDTPVRAVGSINYLQQMRDSRLRLTLGQSATTNSDSEDVVNTNGEITYQRDLTELSSFNIGLRGALSRYEDSDRRDDQRLNLTAQYNHALTRDWGYNVGYTHSYRQSRDVDGARSNAVFFTLRRDFQALK